jgi:hypothetical protein
MSGDFMTLYQDPIPEVIPIQKFEHGSDSQWLWIYGDFKCSMYMPAADVDVFMQTSAPVARELGGCAVRRIIPEVTVNVLFMFSSDEYTDMHFVYRFCNGNATAATEEYEQQFP